MEDFERSAMEWKAVCADDRRSDLVLESEGSTGFGLLRWWSLMVRRESWDLTPALSDVDFLVIGGRGGLNSGLMVGDEQEEGFAGGSICAVWSYCWVVDL